MVGSRGISKVEPPPPKPPRSISPPSGMIISSDPSELLWPDFPPSQSMCQTWLITLTPRSETNGCFPHKPAAGAADFPASMPRTRYATHIINANLPGVRLRFGNMMRLLSSRKLPGNVTRRTRAWTVWAGLFKGMHESFRISISCVSPSRSR